MFERRKFLSAAVSAAAMAAAAPEFTLAKAIFKDDFFHLDALAQAKLVKTKKVSSMELVDAAIKRIELLDPILNSIIHRDFDMARKKAITSSGNGVFQGVPYLCKNLIPCKGLPETHSSQFCAKVMAEEQSPFVDAVNDTGAVLLGLTNSPEFGLLPTTEPTLFGPTNNPWDLSRSPAGSSGGSAAAVAAGLVPIATASDGGGSIRLPASNCALVGLKYSRTRERGSDADFLVNKGCLSRSIRDTAAFLASVEMLEPVDMQKVGFVTGTSKKPLKIAFSTEGYTGEAPSPDVAKALHNTIRLLQELGHEVIEDKPEISGEELACHFLTLFSALPAFWVDMAREKLGREPDEHIFEPWTLGLAKLHREKRHYSAVGDAYEYFRELQQITRRFLKKYEVYLTPVVAQPPIKTGEQAPTVDFELLQKRVFSLVTYTPLANITGLPAMSLPVNWSDDNLPVGSMFMAGFGKEAMLLSLGYELEEARPWKNRWPSIVSN